MPSWKTCLIALPLVAWTASPLAAASEQELWAAAAAGDLERVRSLLEAGVPVDAETAHGATALSFAAEKEHLEVVTLLLEHGADPDVRDTFYRQTPLGWVLNRQPPNLDVALRLIEKGAEDPTGQALATAARLGRRDLLEAILARGALYAFERDAALELARGAEATEVVALLENAPLKDELETVEVAERLLADYAGSYRIANGERTLEVSVVGSTLHLAEDGGEPRALAALAPDHFRVAAEPARGVYFYGRGGTVEYLFLLEGASTVAFEPVRADDVVEKRRRPPLFAPESEPAPPPEVAPAPPRSAAAPWPGFRGPGATGLADGQAPPVRWDVESGQNLRWKTAIPGLGNSSPVVWGDRVFVTTAISSAGEDSLQTGLYGSFDVVDDTSEHTWKTFALDAASGEVVWQRTAGSAVPEADRHLKSSHANSTPATDGERLVVVFPTVGMFCYSLEGELLWQRPLGALNAGWFYDPSYEWGFASSPVIHEGKVLLQVDVYGGGFLAAYDLESGRELWRTARGDEVPTWSTPTVVRGPRHDEVVANGSTIRAYDAATGRELWRLGPNPNVVIATPFAAHGLVYVTASYPPTRPLYAVRPGGEGDLTLAEGESSSRHVAWRSERGGSYMPTPIVYGELLYVGHHNGRLVAFEAKTGEEVYRARFSQKGTLTGSPVAADGRIYFTTEEGLVYVVKAGREHEELAVNELPEAIMTTPAISDGTLYVRGSEHLYAFSRPAEAAASHAAAR